MEKLNLPFFFQLGYELGGIANFRLDETPMIRFVSGSLALQPTLKALKEKAPSLTVSLPSVQELQPMIGELIDMMVSGITDKSEANHVEVAYAKPPNENPPEVQQLVSRMVQKATNLQIVLNAELQSLSVYQVMKTGIYSVPELVENAQDAFPSAVRAKLPEEAVMDIKEGGRCLAFGIGTACGFHVLRATEVVMHSYYEKVCNEGNPSKKLTSWGSYISALRKSEDADAKRIAETLQQLKDHDRNLIMHPRIALTADEAHTLFELSKGAIMAMLQEK